jgi:hypothetical protein
MATAEDTVSHIAKTLGEVEEIPLFQITGIVRVLGEEGAQALLKETLDIEKGGGMLLADGTRRRSPGGVFFQLARRKLPAEEKKNIFREKKAEAEAAPASVRAPAPAASPSSPPGASSASAAGDPSRFTRRRVVEVVAQRPHARGGKPGAFSPPELPSALTRARIRQQVTQAIAPLPIEEQYHLLLDLLADIHDRVSGGAASAADDAPASRPPARSPRNSTNNRRKP